MIQWPSEYPELLSDSRYQFLAEITHTSNNLFRAAVLRLNIPKVDGLDDDEHPPHPLAAVRYEIPATFNNKNAAHREAESIAGRMSAGHFAMIKPEIKDSFGKYRLIVSAFYRIDYRKWQATLVIISKRPENKNAKQDFMNNSSPLQNNHYPTAERAMAFAIQYGKELIQGVIPGLKV